MGQNLLGQKYTYIKVNDQFWCLRKFCELNLLCSMASSLLGGYD